MTKRAVSITLDEANLLWLKGQGYAHGNLSAALARPLHVSESRARYEPARRAPRSRRRG